MAKIISHVAHPSAYPTNENLADPTLKTSTQLYPISRLIHIILKYFSHFHNLQRRPIISTQFNTTIESSRLFQTLQDLC